jgi:hypothetical protein
MRKRKRAKPKTVTARVIDNKDPFHMARIRVTNLGYWLNPILQSKWYTIFEIPKIGEIVRLLKPPEAKRFHYLSETIHEKSRKVPTVDGRKGN